MLRRRECEAPGCRRDAVYIAKGEDFDGSQFEDRVCQRCADYLTTAAAECGKPLTLTRICVPFAEVTDDQ